jgi:DNA (cytosine-5)-methyltransferase 1
MKNPFRLIDLFSGAGGMTLGFTDINDQENEAIFEPVWANDFNEDAVDTYNENFGNHCIHGDIVDLLNDPTLEIPDADVVIGGPPCQGFSLLNKDREIDPRKQLWRPYMDVIEQSGAKVFVMENVRQLLNSAEIHQIKEVASELGFEVASAVLCAADYGVPQERYRAFVIGARNDLSLSNVFPPQKTHYNPKDDTGNADLFDEYVKKPTPWKTVRDAIGDLPEPVGTEFRDEPGPFDLHFGRNPTAKSEKRYRAVPPGGNRFDLEENAPEITPDCWKRKKTGGTDLFGRLWWDRPSVTIRTEFFKPEKGRYLHPVQHRAITHREGARLQSFPDNFKFCGSKIEIARQIGNAVPPLLARAIARSVYSLLSNKDDHVKEDTVNEEEAVYS